MEDATYDVDPDGDVVLILSNPNAPFALWRDQLDLCAEGTFVSRSATPNATISDAADETSNEDTGISEGHAQSETLSAEPLAQPALVPLANNDEESTASTNEEPDPDPKPIVTAAVETLDNAPASKQPGNTVDQAFSAMNLSTDTGDKPSALQSQAEAEALPGPKIRMRLSSRHLILASPVFKRMLLGNWQESNPSSHQEYTVGASDWDTEALLVLMNIIHGRTRKTPRSVNVEMLAKIAVLVDYYECFEVVDMFVSRWLEDLKGEISSVYGRDLVLWLSISWVFQQPLLFRTATKIAIRDMTGPFPTLNLPIPNEVAMALDRVRTARIQAMLERIRQFLRDLCGQRLWCTFECRSMLIGALTIELGRLGLLDATPDSSFPGLSVESTLHALQDMRSPRWTPTGFSRSDSGFHNEPRCSLQSIVRARLHGLDKQAPNGLELTSFSGNASSSSASRRSDPWRSSASLSPRSGLGEFRKPEEIPAVSNLGVVSVQTPPTYGAKGYNTQQDPHDGTVFLQSISAETKYQGFSPEELRIGDYARLAAYAKDPRR